MASIFLISIELTRKEETYPSDDKIPRVDFPFHFATFRSGRISFTFVWNSVKMKSFVQHN